MKTKVARPHLRLPQIFNMSLGFLGIQFGFALQNGNASRILSTFGAQVEHLSWFWLVAPLTGMIVQPLIGFYSDRTWTFMGRRKPYILTGSIVASIALILMPNAQLMAAFLPPLYIGAGFLMILDTSFNVSMEPFRALVVDVLPYDQRTLGFSVQTFLIGLGAVIGSWLPFFLAEFFDFNKVGSETSPIPDNVTFSFYAGSFIFLTSILWTVFTTKEYPPEEGKKEKPDSETGIKQIWVDFLAMPKTMIQLGPVQFFSWFALFTMWVYATPAIANHVYGLPIDDHSSVTFNEASNWVGIIFGVYNGTSAVYAVFLPALAAKWGRKLTHSISLSIGGCGLISIYFIHDPQLLILSMIGVGIAWASILAMPYAILGGAIQPHKMGVYMGLFNFFITLPQICSSLIGGPLVKYLFGFHSIYSIVMAGVLLILGAFSMYWVEDKDDPTFVDRASTSS